MGWLQPFSWPAEALQTQEAESQKLLQAHPAVVMVAEAFEFHAAQAPPNPSVQIPKQPPASGPARGEVVGSALNDSVEFLDKLRVQVVRAGSQFPYLVFELVLGLGAHTFGPARHDKPQEGVTLAVGGDASFLGAQLEAELVEDMRDLGLGLLSLGSGLAEHHKVIGVAHEAVAELVELPVQMVQDDVGQQRAGNPALRGADRGRLEHAIFHDACAKEFLDEVKDVAVGDLGRDCFLDKRMEKVMETADDVCIENDSIAFIVVFHSQFQGLMAVASWTEAEGRLVKQRFEDRMQQAAQDLLSDPVANRGDTERTKFPPAFIEELAT